MGVLTETKFEFNLLGTMSVVELDAGAQLEQRTRPAMRTQEEEAEIDAKIRQVAVEYQWIKEQGAIPFYGKPRGIIHIPLPPTKAMRKAANINKPKKKNPSQAKRRHRQQMALGIPVSKVA